MRKVQEEMPFVPVPDILPGREEGCVEKIRVRVESSVREAEEHLKLLFAE